MISRGIIPHLNAFAGWRYKYLVYGIYPVTSIFPVCSVYAPTYVGLVGSVINTLIAMVCIPSQIKPESDPHQRERSEYLFFLINTA